MSDMESLVALFKAEYPYINNDDIARTLPHLKFRSLEKGEKLVKFGQQYGNVAYVVDGLIKSSSFDGEGNKVIFRFEQANQITGNWHATLFQETSKIEIEAIEPTIVVELAIDLIEKWAAKHLNIARIYNAVMKQILADTLHQLSTYINSKPETRYLQFLKESPDILDRITQKELASYLGVTAVSLSRIKKRVT